MKYFSLESDLSYTFRFCEPVYYKMTISKEEFEFDQDRDTLTMDNFYNLKRFLLANETSVILSLDRTIHLIMTIQLTEFGYLAIFDDDDGHYEFQVDGAFFRDYLKMIQTIEGYRREYTKHTYKGNYDEISDLLKKVYNE